MSKLFTYRPGIVTRLLTEQQNDTAITAWLTHERIEQSRGSMNTLNLGCLPSDCRAHGIQGGPAKVRPTYIFAGNIILVTFECIGKVQWFLANVITVFRHTP